MLQVATQVHIPPPLLFGGLALFFAVLVVSILRYARQTKRWLESFAQELKGAELTCDMALGGLSVDYEGVRLAGVLGEVPVLLDTEVRRCHTQGRNYTLTLVRYQARVNEPILDYTIKKVGVLGKVARALGGQEPVELPDVRQRGKYRVEGHEGELSELFAQPEFEEAVDQLFGFLGCDEVRLSGGELLASEQLGQRTLRPERLRERFSALVTLARLSSRAREAVPALDAGVHLTWRAAGSSPRCPFCRDDLDLRAGALTACAGCDTVHHAECYEEGGGCSIFGCPRRVVARREQL